MVKESVIHKRAITYNTELFSMSFILLSEDPVLNAIIFKLAKLWPSNPNNRIALSLENPDV